MAELERLKQIKCFLFDMDGTINLGNTLIPGMDAFFKKLALLRQGFLPGYQQFFQRAQPLCGKNAPHGH